MRIIRFDTLPSTNTYAKENIDNLGHFDIILAGTQTAGRGRLGRSWHSGEGGLYFSLILKPQKAQPALTQAMALSVCTVLRAYGAQVYLKWPNDVLADGKKICGILSEAVFQNNFLKGIIIGVGINISQRQILSDKPAATIKQSGIDIEKQKLLGEVLDLFGQNYSRLQEGGFRLIKTDYKTHFPYLGKEISINAGPRVITGAAFDLDDDGRLLVKTANGIETATAGDMDF